MGTQITNQDRAGHWRKVWREKSPEGTSWFQSEPEMSLSMIEAAGFDPSQPLIDIGGGASLLIDRLIEMGCADLSVLDIAPEAMRHTRQRLGEKAGRIEWIAADAARWMPDRQYALWHDRAVFHFLTDPEDRSAYAGALRAGLARDGQAVIATFALNGPEKCSGLTVQRHGEKSLLAALGGGYEIRDTRTEDHITPGGAVQRFFWCRIARAA